MRPMGRIHRWTIPLIATGVNLLFEYSMRGVNDLPARPALPLFLFLWYFPYFALLNEFITRFRLRDYHLVVAGFLFGTFFALLAPFEASDPAGFLGVNWGSFLFVNLAWWGGIQGVMTLYIANRLAPREWQRPPLPPAAVAGIALWLVAVILLFRQFTPGLPSWSGAGAATMAALATASAFLLWKLLPEPSSPPPPSGGNRVMDVLSASTIAVALFSALFLTFDSTMLGVHPVNQTAVRVVVVWTLIAAPAMLAHRLLSKRPIPV